MLADQDRAALSAAWEPARRAGVLGSASIEELWEHTAGFASAVCSAFSAECSTWNGRVLDAGTGAGVPGVLLAAQLPQARFTLADALDRRLDHVRSAVRALGLGDRVDPVHGRIDDMAHDMSHRAAYDVVVARLLADPAEAAELLVPCVAPGGLAVVSARPKHAGRWEAACAALGADVDVVWSSSVAGHYVSIRVVEPPEQRFPRRATARLRKPLI